MPVSNGTKGWIVIIVSIVLAFGGMAFGIVEGQVKKDLKRIDEQEEVNHKQDAELTEIRIQGAVIQNELEHINNSLQENAQDVKEIKQMLEQHREED